MKTFRDSVSRAHIQSSIVVFIGSMIANGSAYLYHVFVGRILGPTQYGELAALLSLFFILNVPSAVVQTVLVKFFSSLKAKNSFGQARYLFVHAIRAIALLEAVVFVLLLPFFPFIGAFLHIKELSSFTWLYLIFAFYFLGSVSGSFLQGFQKFGVSMLYTNIGMLLRLLLGVLFAIGGVGWTLFSNVLSNLISFGALFIPIRFLFSYPAERFEISKRAIFSYSVPTFLATLCITLLYTQDVVLVKHFFSPFEAGVYSSLSVLGKIIYFASSSIGFVLFPIASEHDQLGKKSHGLVTTALLAVGVLSLVLNLVYFLAPTFVVHLLFGKAFDSASGYLGFFGLFITFFSLSQLLISSCLAANKIYVWVFTSLAAIIQAVAIFLFHSSILTIIMINFYVSLGLFVVLLIYYFYAKR